MIGAIGLLVIAIVFIMLRGDQIGLAVQAYGPAGTGSSRATIRLTLDEDLLPASAASRLAISPAVQGTMRVEGSQVIFQPAQGFSQGQQYTITVRSGLQGKDGRLLKQDIQWVFRAAGPRIVYMGPADSVTHDLFLFDPLTEPPGRPGQQLTHSPKGILSFDVAPDGSSIVYAELQSKSATNLYLLDPASGKSKLLYACPDSSCNDPAWSPDGKWIAFEKAALDAGLGTPGSPRTWLIDPVTGSAKALFAEGQRLGYSPRWSPDSQRIAVADANAGGIDVHNLTTQADVLI
ncbi:MAG TPA: Ig-like domain-containing protein, partial [Aggregatilineales bacterium]|nr:Ig-like domain-containing protein [Aggregatilineales bacterium]